MTLVLHNTLTGKDDPFLPQEGNQVRLYTCGPTVYDYLHVGNWTAYIYWDVLVRVLLANSYNVTRVMNITDVGHLVSDEDSGEDKLEKGARREGKTAWEVAEFYNNDFLEGMKKLGLVTPQHIVKATDFISQQLDLIQTLRAKGYTYQIYDGIYFDTSKFPPYANFAHLDLNAQKAGARVEFNEEKRNSSDFALWKFTSINEKRDMEWETPNNLLDMPSETPRMGFPGWHLECSAMAMSILGETLDIHTGGIDHIPVHHTNEIAQSEASSGKQFSRFWLHNNHLKVNGTKISKSLGNGYILQDLASKGYSPMDFRMFVLQGQYSNEGNFTFENLTGARNRLSHWKAVATLRHQIHITVDSGSDSEETVFLLATSGAIMEALNDNLNTPKALQIIDEAFARVDATDPSKIHQAAFIQLLEKIDETLGLNLLNSTPDVNDDLKQLILERVRIREDKNWQKSDELRDQLDAKGITVRDTKFGTIWSYKDAV
jgi:cysteinyl-tRNA synthetase